MLTPDLVAHAAAQGAFPMGEDDGSIEFYLSNERALFDLTIGIRVSRRLSRSIKNCGWDVRFDTSFEQVMRSCLRPSENWINDELIRCYVEIHQEGWGHCCEVWDGAELVGGVYGIALGGLFCAESMFHRKTNASKLALMSMVSRCRELGFVVFDAQVMNPHLASLGAFSASQYEYAGMLEEARKVTTEWSRDWPY